MEVSPSRPLRARLQAWVPFVLSAALVATAIHAANRDPFPVAFVALFVALMFLPSYFARRRFREVLRSGDVRSVLHAWSADIARVDHPETIAPIITAAAFASCGWVDQARTALERAARGPVWDAAIEYRLFVETLLDAFEGDREGAIAKASRLAALPLPEAPMFAQGKIRILRDALSAFARAFAHTSNPTDMALLERASQKSPLVHWAMRYAAAVAAVDHGRFDHARKLLQKAPDWPQGSAFRSFHDELTVELGLRSSAAAS